MVSGSVLSPPLFRCLIIKIVIVKKYKKLYNKYIKILMCKRFYMKNISEMTIKEIEDEIKMAKFDANENYVFVSYSHMDYKQVYPMVLRWIRK